MASPKLVMFWKMTVIEEKDPETAGEVIGESIWFPVPAAIQRLTHAQEKSLISRLGRSAPKPVYGQFRSRNRNSRRNRECTDCSGFRASICLCCCATSAGAGCLIVCCDNTANIFALCCACFATRPPLSASSISTPSVAPAARPSCLTPALPASSSSTPSVAPAASLLTAAFCGRHLLYRPAVYRRYRRHQENALPSKMNGFVTVYCANRRPFA